MLSRTDYHETVLVGEGVEEGVGGTAPGQASMCQHAEGSDGDRWGRAAVISCDREVNGGWAGSATC